MYYRGYAGGNYRDFRIRFVFDIIDGRNLMLHGHGGNTYTVARQFGWKPSELLDMSSNINALGPPSGLLEHLKNEINTLTALPEVDSAETSNLFAKHMNIEPERVLAGNGTTQIL